MFSNLNATGRCGPTSLGSYYAGKDHDRQVALSSGIQQWTVPHTGDYRVEAMGQLEGTIDGLTALSIAEEEQE